MKRILLSVILFLLLMEPLQVDAQGYTTNGYINLGAWNILFLKGDGHRGERDERIGCFGGGIYRMRGNWVAPFDLAVDNPRPGDFWEIDFNEAESSGWPDDVLGERRSWFTLDPSSSSDVDFSHVARRVRGVNPVDLLGIATTYVENTTAEPIMVELRCSTISSGPLNNSLPRTDSLRVDVNNYTVANVSTCLVPEGMDSTYCAELAPGMNKVTVYVWNGNDHRWGFSLGMSFPGEGVFGPGGIILRGPEPCPDFDDPVVEKAPECALSTSPLPPVVGAVNPNGLIRSNGWNFLALGSRGGNRAGNWVAPFIMGEEHPQPGDTWAIDFEQAESAGWSAQLGDEPTWFSVDSMRGLGAFVDISDDISDAVSWLPIWRPLGISSSGVMIATTYVQNITPNPMPVILDFFHIGAARIDVNSSTVAIRDQTTFAPLQAATLVPGLNKITVYLWGGDFLLGIRTAEANPNLDDQEGAKVGIIFHGNKLDDLDDTDDDGVVDLFDNCPRMANANQTDDDDDGVGDHCQVGIVFSGTVIEPGAEWRFLGGVDPGPSPNWNTPGFDDSAWEVGPTGIGYGDGDDATILDDMEDNYVVLYARKEFEVRLDVTESLVLSCAVDDGLVAYVNGTEIGRFNVAGGEVLNNTPAIVANPQGEPVIDRPIELSINRDLLVEGENIIAVSVHNSPISSNDLSFIPTLFSVARDQAGDEDNDGVIDTGDNCPFAANNSQVDGDHDGVGDACDNCLETANSLQLDLDNDGVGDICTPGQRDQDGDQYVNTRDNCPLIENVKQLDSDGDSVGDVCDNCISGPNPLQEDLDGDDLGDVCDEDADNDGDPDETDCSPLNPDIHNEAREFCDDIDSDCDGSLSDEFTDTDGDGVPDCADEDDDSDGDPDETDCAPLDPAVHHGARESCDDIDSDCDGSLTDDFPDTDGDGAPDCTDEDDDNDGDPDETDCAPLNPAMYNGAREFCDNIDSDCDGSLSDGFADTDRDGFPDCIDEDVDGDGVPDVEDTCPGHDDNDDGDGDGSPDGCDNCPFAPNNTQSDVDNDGLGDACDEDADNDGDPDKTDCSPLNPDIHNGARESCDDIDSDCDGSLTDDFPDTDGDGAPDCTDEDDDNDGDPDEADCAPLDSAVHHGARESCDDIDSDCDGSLTDDFPDTDGDGAPDCTDEDDDNDGDPDEADCAPLDSAVHHGARESCDDIDSDCDGSLSDEFRDSDGDGLPDCIDEDVDGDGVPDGEDACPGQDDNDDADGDGNPDECDNCPLSSNNAQADLDEDGLGDVCDSNPLGRTYRVPEEFSTIQAAVDEAETGDEIVVGPGTYTGTADQDEVVDLRGKIIWLHSSNGPRVTIINGENRRRGIIAISGEGVGTRVEGLSIINGRTLEPRGGGGMHISDSSPTVVNCVFRDNAAFEDGGGMSAWSSRPSLVGCVFENNRTNLGGGGMFNNESDPILRNCIFRGNSAVGGGETGGGGAINNIRSSPILINCVFNSNTARSFGGAIYNRNSFLALVNCTFKYNTVAIEDESAGGGIYSTASSPEIEGSDFCENGPAHIEGPWTDSGSNRFFEDCDEPPASSLITVPGDHPTIQAAIDAAHDGDEVQVSPGTYPETLNLLGKAVWVHSTAGPASTIIDGEDVRRGVLCINGEDTDSRLEGFTIRACVGADLAIGEEVFVGGGGLLNYSSSPRITGCVFTDNTTDSQGGGVYSYGNSSPSFNGCTFEGNRAAEGGGAYNAHNSNPWFSGCEFKDNIAEVRGGAIFSIVNSNPTVSDSNFCGNESSHIEGSWTGLGENEFGAECIAAEGQFKRGDSNNDGAVDIGDAIFSLTWLFLGGGPPTCMATVDANDSGQVDIGDAIFCLTFLFLGGESMPAPFPDCGSDPTEDILECERYDHCP